jgi:hypothetical protein
MIVDLARITHANALQIDFDAPESARPFYRALVADVRRELGPDVFLSVTALLSWCATPHSWLHNLPADEIVPMAFDPGVRPGAGVPAGMEISWPDPVWPEERWNWRGTSQMVEYPARYGASRAARLFSDGRRLESGARG